jgi:hypothetical protein
MPLNRDTTSLDTTYGMKQERIQLTWEYHAPSTAHGAASVNGAATLRAANAKRKTCIIYNNSGVTAYFGAAGVAVADGLPLVVGGSMTLETTAAIYVITAGATDLRFMEELAGNDA